MDKEDLESKYNNLNQEFIALKEAYEKAQQELKAKSSSVVEDNEQNNTNNDQNNNIEADDTIDTKSKLTIEQQKDVEAATFLRRRAEALAEEVLYDKARPLHEEACLVIQKTLGTSSAVTLEFFLSKAINLRNMNLFFDAQEVLHLALSYLPTVINPPKDLGYMIEFELLECYLAQGLFAATNDRLDSLSKLLALKVQNSDKVNPEINRCYGLCLNIQAKFALENNKLNEAKAYNERSMVILSKEAGPNHPQYLDTMMVKCKLLLMSGKGKEAISMMDQRVMTLRRVFNNNTITIDGNYGVGTDNIPNKGDVVHHPMIADTILHCGISYLMMCNILEAKKKLNAARFMLIKFFDENDLRVIEVDYHIAELHYLMGEYFESRDLHLRIVSRLDQAVTRSMDPSLNKRHIVFSSSFYALGKINERIGDYTVAKDCYDRAIRFRQDTTNHPLVSLSKLGLISLLHIVGKYSETRPALEEVMNEIRNNLSKEHILYLKSILVYANYLFRMNEKEDACKHIQKTIKKLRSAFNAGHSMIADAWILQVEIDLTNNDLSEAKKHLEDLKIANQAVFGVAVGHENYATICAHEGRYLMKTKLVEAVENAGKRSAPTKQDQSSNVETEKVATEPAANTVTTAAVTVEESGILTQQSMAESSIQDTAAIIEDTNTGSTNVEPVISDTIGEVDNNNIRASQQFIAETALKVPAPQFDNSTFKDVLELFQVAMEKFKRIFLQPMTINVLEPGSAAVSKPSTADGTNKRKGKDGGNVKFYGNPMLSYTKGLMAQIQLMEFTATYNFIESLSSEERERYFQEQVENDKKKQLEKKLNEVKINQLAPDPPGRKDMEQALYELKSIWHLELDHAYIKDLDTVLTETLVQFNDMQIAQHSLMRANLYKSQGHFLEADRLYQHVLTLYHQCLGPIQCAQSLIVAEVIYEIADNGRNLGQPADFVRSLYLLAIRIYKLYCYSNNSTTSNSADLTQMLETGSSTTLIEDEFIWKNNLGAIDIIVDQKRFEEAFTMHLQVEASQQFAQKVVPAKVANNQSRLLMIIKTKINIARDLIQMYRYDEALQIDSKALDMLKNFSLSPMKNSNTSHRVDSTDNAEEEADHGEITELLIRVFMNEVHIYDALGKFNVSEDILQEMDNVFSSWKDYLTKALTPEEKQSTSAAAQPVGESFFHAAADEPEYPALYYKLNAILMHAKAEHECLVNKFNNCKQHTLQAMKLFSKLYNLHEQQFTKAVPGNKTTIYNKNTSNKNGGNQQQKFQWTVQKEAEMKKQYIQVLEELLYSNIKDDKNAHKKTINVTNNDDSAVAQAVNQNNKIKPSKTNIKGGKNKTKDDAPQDDAEEEAFEATLQLSKLDINNDFASTNSSQPAESTASAPIINNPNKATDGSVSGLSLVTILTANSKVSIPFDGKQYSAHARFVDCLYLLAKVAVSLYHVPACKESLEACHHMLQILQSKTMKLTFFQLQIRYLMAEWRFLHNQIGESQQMHASLLEQRLSLATTKADQNLDVSDSYLSLARLALLKTQYEDALQFAHDALKIERKVFNGASYSNILTSNQQENHYRVQRIMLVCSEIMLQKGLYNDCSQLTEKLIKHYKVNYSEHFIHNDLAIAWLQRATATLYLSRWEEALSYVQQSRSICMSVFGEEHVLMALIRLTWSQILRAMGKYLDAKTQLDTAIQVSREQVGKYHFYTIFILLEMGLNFMDLGKYVTSKHVLDRAIHLLKKSVGKDHYIVGVGLFALGQLNLKMGLLNNVQSFLDDALYVYRKNIGSDRHATISTILGVSHYLKALQGSYDLAVAGFDDVLSTIKLLFNTPHHALIANTTILLAESLLLQGKIFDAQSQYERVLLTMKMIYPGQDHILVYEAMYGLAKVRYFLGYCDQAKAMLERVLQSFRDWLGASHPSISRVLTLLGNVLNEMGKSNLAKQVLVDAYSILQRSLLSANENHFEAGEVFLSFAEHLRWNGLYDSPSKLLKDNNEGATSSSGKRNKNKLLNSSNNTTALSTTQGLNEPAAENTNKHTDNIDDAASAPTVMISAVEMLDNDFQQQKQQENQPFAKQDPYNANKPVISTADESNNENGSNTYMTSVSNASNANNFLENEELFRALPMLSRALQLFQHAYSNDNNHPHILQVNYLQAEVYKGLGDYEVALELHETTFQTRRKVLGESHLDTIKSLLAIGELLRVMKRVFILTQSGNNLNVKAFQGASNANSGLDVMKDAPKIIGTVTLRDQFQSLLQPVHLTYKPPSSPSSNKHSKKKVDDEDFGTKILAERDWVFLTKEEDPAETNAAREIAKRRMQKAARAASKGFMGYSFPPAIKKVDMNRPSTSSQGASSSNFGSTSGGGGGGGTLSGFDGDKLVNNSLRDPKKCLDAALSLLKKLLAQQIAAVDLTVSNNNHGGSGTNSRAPSANNHSTGGNANQIDHPLIALAYFNKAEVMRLRGDCVTALKLLEQSLAMRRRLFRAQHPAVADCLFSLAELLRQEQRYAQAQPLYDKALEIRVRAYSWASTDAANNTATTNQEEVKQCNHPAVAEVYCSLSMLALSKGDLQTSSTYSQQALAISQSALGSQHIFTASAHLNQAALLQAQGVYNSSLQHYKQALQVKQVVLGNDHPEIAAIYNNIALLFRAQGNAKEAMDFFEQALDIQKRILGNQHPDVATTLNNLGALLANTPGKRSEAKDCLKQALSIRMICFGAHHLLVATAMNNYASLLMSLQEYQAAKDLLEDALSIRRKSLGENHPLVAEIQSNLGCWYYAKRFYSDALSCFAEALRIRRVTYLSDKHPTVATSLLQLSATYHRMKKRKEAVDHVIAAIDIRKELLGELHNDTVTAKRALIGLMNAYGNNFARQYHMEKSASNILQSTDFQNHNNISSGIVGGELQYDDSLHQLEGGEGALTFDQQSLVEHVL